MMTLTRKLLLLSLANITVACALFALHRDYGEFNTLAFDLRGQISTDSSRFIERAWSVVHANLPLYETLFFKEHYKFIYPTSSLLTGLIARLLGVPMGTLVKWLVLISAPLTLLIAGDCFLILHSGNPAVVGRRWRIRLLIASLGFFFYPLVCGVGLGQIQTFLTLLFTLSVWFWLRGQKAAAGFCIALMCVFKPPMALFLVWAILRRQWSFFWSFAVSALVMQVVSGFVFGWHNEFGYLAVLSYLSHHGEIISENQSVNGLLERWFHNGRTGYWTDTSPYPAYNAVIYAGTMLSSAVFVLFGLIVPVLRRWQGTPSDFVFFGLVSTIASPIVWTHYYGLFYIGCMYFLAVSLRQSGRIPYLFVASYLLLANYWRILGRLHGDLSVVLFTYDLFAGIGIILSIAFYLDHSRAPDSEALVEARLPVSQLGSARVPANP